MKTISSIGLAPVLAAVLLTGCEVGYRHVPYSPVDRPIPRDTGERHARAVRGTVKSVDPREHTIVLTPGDRDDREIVLSYDEDTTVEYQGRTYRPENLEPGDGIEAAVERSPEGLVARAIQVLQNAHGGEGQEEMDRGDMDRDDRAAMTLRGVVRSNDTDGQTVDIERSGPQDRGSDVTVRYDDKTVVEYQGRRYGPENLERGDAVEIELRDGGGEPIADRIVVVGEGQPVRH
jgi:hypothetical protein